MSNGNLFLLSIERVVAHCRGCWLSKWSCTVAKRPTGCRPCCDTGCGCQVHGGEEDGTPTAVRKAEEEMPRLWAMQCLNCNIVATARVDGAGDCPETIARLYWTLQWHHWY
jgi:hypothetical protein